MSKPKIRNHIAIILLKLPDWKWWQVVVGIAIIIMIVQGHYEEVMLLLKKLVLDSP